MKNGRYKDWKAEAAVKFCIYQDEDLQYVYYSFYREDKKFRYNCEIIAQSMFNRLVIKYPLQRDRMMIAYDNRSSFPQKIIRMWDFRDSFDYWRREVRRHWKPQNDKRHP